MKEIQIDIIDYLGKINDGALVLISIIYDGDYYEGTFYYNTSNVLALTVEERLENIFGCTVEQLPEYNDIMVLLIRRTVPIEEIITRLDEIDIDKYIKSVTEQDIVFIDSDDSQFISPTQS